MSNVLVFLGITLYFIIGLVIGASGLLVRYTIRKVVEAPSYLLKTDKQREAQQALLDNYESLQRKLLWGSIAAVFVWPVTLVVNLIRKRLKKSA